MNNSTTPAACHNYELEIAIDAARETVWKCIFEDTNLWWLPDFHVASADSVVTFDVSPGGRGLVEESPDGGWLQWYEVQMYLPSQYEIYLIGHIAPDWGGPTTSSLKLAVVETEKGCILKVTDSRHGNVDAAKAQSYEDGWKQLFSDGLKKFAESKA